MNYNDKENKFTIVCGHYGCGKSNFALNLAFQRAEEGHQVILTDLDLVNPYFLSSDYKQELEAKGIRVVAPMFAGTNVETPALPADLSSIFTADADVIVDLGGDDAGSIVLGRYHEQLKNIDYEMLYLVNRYRNLTATPQEAAQVLWEIERASRCKATAVVNNSHLKNETTWETIEASIPYAQQTAELLQLPIWGNTILSRLLQEHGEQDPDRKWYPIEIYVKTVWEKYF